MTTQEIEARVESLERGMRRWRMIAIIGLVFGMVGGVAELARWIDPTFKELEVDMLKAHSVHVLNSRGELSAYINGAATQAKFGNVLLDADGVRVSRPDPENRNLATPTVRLGFDANGYGRVSVWSPPGGFEMAFLGLDEKGNGQMGVFGLHESHYPYGSAGLYIDEEKRGRVRAASPSQTLWESPIK